MGTIEDILGAMKDRPDIFSIYYKSDVKDGIVTEEVRVERFTAGEQPGKEKAPAGFIGAVGFGHPSASATVLGE